MKALLILVCAGYRLTLHDFSLTLRTPQEFTFELPLSAKGDCAAKKNCYQDGQLMVIVRGKTAWINTDTDDLPGRGDRLKCKEVKK